MYLYFSFCPASTYFHNKVCLHISWLQHCLLSAAELLCAKSCARSVNPKPAFWETPGWTACLVPYTKAIFVGMNLPAVSPGQFLHSLQSQVWQKHSKSKREKVATQSSIAPTGAAGAKKGSYRCVCPCTHVGGVAPGRAFCALAHFLGLPHNRQCDRSQISNSPILGFLIYPWEFEFLHSAVIIRNASSKRLWTNLAKLGR